MLVIISDLHLTDHTSGETIEQGAFFLLRERLFRLAYDASWRAPNVYKPIEHIDLLLLGDILDVIRSAKWCSAPRVRPWTAPTDDEFSNLVSEITNDILAHNQRSLEVVKSLSHSVTVPAADENHRPVADKDDFSAGKRMTVPVRVHYMVGNHDWFFHLPGGPFDAIRARVLDTMGLSNPSGPFPHDPLESPELIRIFAEHKVWARHGDIFDSNNFDGDRNKSSLGDAIVVELLNRFPEIVQQKFGSQLPPECLEGLREIDNVRPLVVIPTWIDGVLRRECSPEMAQAVKETWNDLVDRFLKVDFVKQHKAALKFALKISTGVSVASLSKLLLWLKAKFGIGNEGPFFPNALNEKPFKDGTAQFFVYGHTHHHELIGLRAAEPGSKLPLGRIYINSGTWRAVHEMAQADPKAEEFVAFKVMTYLVFYKGHERVSRQFESWSGALGSST